MKTLNLLLLCLFSCVAFAADTTTNNESAATTTTAKTEATSAPSDSCQKDGKAVDLKDAVTITSPVEKWSFNDTETIKWAIKDGVSCGDYKADVYIFFTNGTDPVKFNGEGKELIKQEVPVKDLKLKVDLTEVDAKKYPASAPYYFIRIGDAYKGQFSNLFVIEGGKCTNCVVNSQTATQTVTATKPVATITTATLKPTTTPSTDGSIKNMTISAIAILFSVLALLF